MDAKPVVVALIGNPNAGKSTLFNALSGLRQHVGNYPGVTVEMKKGQFACSGRTFELVDLPGTYSLAPRSPDEAVAVDLLLGTRPEQQAPDVVLCVADASNLDRHLYLVTQVLDLGKPVVLAVNMVDVADRQGVKLRVEELAAGLGVQAVAIQANRGVGLDALKQALVQAVGSAAPPPIVLPEAVAAEVRGLAESASPPLPTFLAQRLLFDVGGALETRLVAQTPALAELVRVARERLADQNLGVPGSEAKARFAAIRRVTARAVTRPAVRPRTASDRIDRVLTHRVWGTLVFVGLMAVMFQAIFVWAKPLMDLIDTGRTLTAEYVGGLMAPGPLQALLADGILKGVGSVVVFLPQILILFLFIAVLEDCGYMARAAFLMDRVMSRCGLNGKSFIPMLSSVACAVPGIMATRVIENRRDRLATIVVAPLMSCSARLPVYVLFIGAFLTDGFPRWLPGVTLLGLYLLGFVVAPLVALCLKSSVLKGETPLFVLELPAYHLPRPRAVLRRMLDAGWAFLRRAGTLILATMVVIWAALYFPAHDAAGESYPERVAALTNKVGELEAKGDEAEDAKKEAEAERSRVLGEWKRQSYLGRVGLAIEPVVRPLGWDWKIGTAALASFPAREVFVGTFALLYDQGELDAKAASESESLRGSVRSEWEANPARGRYAVSVALSVLVFIALCCQCASTLAVIRRETQSWAWPAFTFAYMTALAYLGAFVTFQLGRLVTDLVG